MNVEMAGFIDENQNQEGRELEATTQRRHEMDLFYFSLALPTRKQHTADDRVALTTLHGDGFMPRGKDK